MLILASCGSPGSSNSYSTNPGTDSSVVIEVAPDSLSRSTIQFPDTITLHMHPSGTITWEADSLKITDLQREVQDTLLNLFLRRSQLPARLDIEYTGTVTMGIRGAADDMIRQAQQVVINAIAVKTLSAPYGGLSAAQQQKFQAAYPVLFQKFY